MIVVQGEVEDGDGKHVDGTAVGERRRRVPLIGKARLGTGVADVVAQLEPLDRGDRCLAVDVIAAGAGLDDILIYGLLSTSETVAGPCAEVGVE